LRPLTLCRRPRIWDFSQREPRCATISGGVADATDRSTPTYALPEIFHGPAVKLKANQARRRGAEENDGALVVGLEAASGVRAADRRGSGKDN
jgi:hypothetical protein